MAIISHFTDDLEPLPNGWRRCSFVFVLPDGGQWRHGPMEFEPHTDIDAARAGMVGDLNDMLRQREIEANLAEVLS